VGFRSAPVKGVPFILWFICGIIPWFFFADAWSSSTGCFVEYSYLVKKVAFRISMLPIIKVFSSLFVHIIFVMFLLTVFAIMGFFPGIKAVQLLYYSCSMAVLAVALGFITSSLVVFFRDLTQIVSIILQFGMWLTPIMWPITMIPDNFVWIFKMNPLYYIVTGYRDAMIERTWFFMNIKQTFYFWIVTGILFLIGAVIFKRTRAHFADVL
jgi:ABC-type polysaccharide/polyol phosphate export permease